MSYILARRFRRAALVCVVSVSALAFSACGGSGADGSEPVEFGYVGWPEAIAKTHISETMVQALGHETESSELTLPAIFQGLETGDLDLFVEAWLPSMQSNLDSVEEGTIESLAVNLPETTYSLAVNGEAYEAGVVSHEDLDDFRGEFDGEVYGIEPGNDGNEIIIEMIENDTYGLGDWEIVESSTSGMLGEVGRRTGDGEWVVFAGWEPHWMNQQHDMEFLEDPEGAWGEQSHVETLANAEFAGESPELRQLFSQMRLDKDVQATWIDQIDNTDKEPEEIAIEWLSENPEMTQEWMDGVEATDGTDGFEALQSYLEEQGA